MIKAYASYFVSYLINNFKKIENISDIILFGSAAKGEAKKSSDIDFFIEVKRNSKNFEKEIIDLVNDFYKLTFVNYYVNKITNSIFSGDRIWRKFGGKKVK